MARRGNARFTPDQLRTARCALLGAYPHQINIEGRFISQWFFAVDTQPEVGEEAYDRGADVLYEFFHRTLSEYDWMELTDVGRQILQCCFDRGSVEDYRSIISFQ